MKFHVFPTGPMCSIRRALMLWLVPLFLVVGAASAAISYWTYGRMTSAFMDDQMEQLAQSVLLQKEHTLPQGQALDRVHKWGTYVVQTYAPDGQLLGSTLPGLHIGRVPVAGFHDVEFDGSSWRVFVAAADAPRAPSVQVIQSGEFRAHLVAERAGAALAPILVLLLLSMLVLWGLVRAISRALQDIGLQAAAQDAHSIAQLPLERVPEEVQPLVSSFNGLLERLRNAFTAQQRFVQDAAHELRTPIAAVGLQLENLRPDCCEGPSVERFAQLELGVRRAQRMVDQLLRMSRQEAAGAGAAAADAPVPVDLQAQLHESMNTLIALADQRGIDLGFMGPERPAAPLTLRCPPGDLRSVLDNLIENALRYTPEGGVVDVRLFEDKGQPVIEVVDTGPGIPQEMLPRVFDRFFRVPGNGVPGGSGLGLAIAQGAARRCGLRVLLRNREDRSGLVARVEPASSSPAKKALRAS